MTKKLEGWMSTGWHRNKDGTTDVAVGNYDIPGTWHVLLREAEGVEVEKIYRMEEGERRAETREISDEIIEFAVAFYNDRKVTKQEQQDGTSTTSQPASGEGDQQPAGALSGPAGADPLLGGEPGLRPT